MKKIKKIKDVALSSALLCSLGSMVTVPVLANIVIDERGISGDTQLMSSVKRSDQALVNTLIQIDRSKVDVQDANGDTPLIVAARKGNLDIMRILLRNGANLAIKNNNGSSAFIEAALNNNFAMIEQLVQEGVDVSMIDNTGRTALAYLIYRNNYGASSFLLKRILENGVDFSQYDNDGNTLLHHASSSGMYPVVKILIENGAIEEPNKNGETALHLAVENGQTEVVRYLLNNDFYVDRAGRSGRTPLIYAAYGDDTSLTNLLLKSGADATIQDKDGNTALHISIVRSSLAGVKTILGSGQFSIDMVKNLSNNMGYSPLSLSEEVGTYFLRDSESYGIPVAGQLRFIFDMGKSLIKPENSPRHKVRAYVEEFVDGRIK